LTLPLVGIDFSIRSPAITVWYNRSLACGIDGCELHVLTKMGRVVNADRPGTTKISAYLMPGSWTSHQQRHDMLASWVMRVLRWYGPAEMVAIEDYAFGAKGRVFDIAEATGVVKDRLWAAGYPITLVKPQRAKIAATGKGNARKEEVVAAFRTVTGVDLHEVLGYRPTKSSLGPSSDLADSYFVLRALALERLTSGVT
jgi:Holliday junction resolvasome RuvABC endonuclease subunit